MSTRNEFPASQLPNPLSPMSFLPPDLAFQVTISIYIFVGALAVMVWDILNNLKSDYLLLTKYRISWPTIAYFISRLASFGFILTGTLFETAPIGNCAVIEKATDWLFTIAVAGTSLLFFFRLRAIFDRNKYVVGFFGFMWLAVVAGCLTSTSGITAAYIGPTQYCVNVSVADYVKAAAIIPLVNDTLVFFAITWRLRRNSYADCDPNLGIKALLFGDYLPSFTRALLQDGQVYYLTTVISGLLTLIMQFIPSVPAAYQTMFVAPNAVLMNVMACRVFRNTKFGRFRENTTSTSKIGLQEPSNAKPLIPLSFIRGSRGQRPTSNGTTFDASVIDVTKAVDQTVVDYIPDNKVGLDRKGVV
ncbi:hypothetical protein GALMADRAFT_228998 [Galerina marginata CBS 339.88]|uniref:G-protein coupled receptors family 1 profile domain-containing protein n=1 Tax=Galerina marginata (strain CBS 339.88) TaxID=685588 RepID=A0A067SRQ4_GALM3|nr:hypothetical protein GALMADRAFT_228998 [Galerina marginata CBS 339.88]